MYVLNVCSPMHMNIKYESSIVDGFVISFKEVSLITKLIKNKVEQVCFWFILSSLLVKKLTVISLTSTIYVIPILRLYFYL